MMATRKRNIINKKSKGYHKKFYLSYTKERERELYALISSLDGVSRLHRAYPCALTHKEHTKYLIFYKEGLKFEISISSSMKSDDRYDSKYYYTERFSEKNNSIKSIVFINASLCFYNPKDVLEFVELMCQLYLSYYRKKTCLEMKEMVNNYQLSFIGACFGDADDIKLTDLFIEKHQLIKDRFGLTYYFINELSIKTLQILEDEDWHDEDDDGYGYYFGNED